MTRPSDSGASGVDWGAPIAVDGKRPEWLAPGEGNGGQVDYDGHWCRQRGTYDQWCWEGVTAIRLPADHPHYRQPQPADTVTVGREFHERMVAFVHAAAGDGHTPYAFEAGQIVAMMPTMSKLDRFMAAHPDADRATAEKALAWGEGE